MKLAIIHLSDIHFRINNDENYFWDVLEKVIQSINDVINENDEFLVTISGDLTNGGDCEEFKKFNYYFKKFKHELIEKIKNIKGKDNVGYIKFLVVPGNHDVTLGDQDTYKNIHKFFQDGTYESAAIKKLDDMSNFFNFARSHRIFLNDRFVDNQMIYYKKNGKKIVLQVCMINTAIFSTLEPNNRDLHIIPQNSCDNIKILNNSDYMITLMHHSINCFSEKIKNKLKNNIESNSSIVFTGHEHSNDAYETSKFGNTVYIESGAFEARYGLFTDFNVVEIDFYTRSGKVSEYNLQNGKLYFTRKSKPECDFKLTLKKMIIKYNSIFLDDFITDRNRKYLDASSFNDLFIFPPMVIDDDVDSLAREFSPEKQPSNAGIIKKYDEFNSIVNQYDVIKISGNKCKTSILKKIYFENHERKRCIYIDAKNIQSTQKNVDKILVKYFKEQLEIESEQVKNYIYEKSDEKILLIDNFDKLSDELKVSFLKLKECIFNKIYFTQAEFTDNELFDIVREAGVAKFVSLKIELFSREERHKLIDSVAKYKRTRDPSFEIERLEIEKIKKYVDSIYNENHYSFDYAPDDIVDLVSFIFSEKKYYENVEEGNIFSNLFVINVLNNLKRFDGVIAIDVIISLFSEIAYKIYLTNNNEISVRKLIDFVNEYKDRKALYDISESDVTKIMVESKLFSKINKNGDKYRFNKSSELAYFIANYINTSLQGNEKEKKYASNYLISICNNVTDNYNSDIILFVVYLTKGSAFLEYLISNIEKYMEDLDDGTITENSNIINRLPKAREHEDDENHAGIEAFHNEIDNNLNEMDYEIGKRKYESSKIVELKEIGSDNHTVNMAKTVEYTKLIAKAIYNFTNQDKEVKEKLYKLLFESVRKLCWNFVKDFEITPNELVDEIFESINESMIMDEQENITKEDIAKLLSLLGLVNVLSIISYFTRIQKHKGSILMNDLFLREYQEDLYYDIYLLNVYAHAGKPQEFRKKLLELASKYKKNKKIMAIINVIFEKYVFDNKDAFKTSERKSIRSQITIAKQKQKVRESKKITHSVNTNPIDKK